MGCGTRRGSCERRAAAARARTMATVEAVFARLSLTATQPPVLFAAFGLDDELLDALREDAATSALALSTGLDACAEHLLPAQRALLAVALLAERERPPPPSMPKRHITLKCSKSGLCNRLRTVLSHALFAAESDGAALTIVWSPTDECPGVFGDHFDPIPGVRFVEHMPATIDEDGELVEANDYHASCKGLPAREALCWHLLQPTDAVRAAVAANLQRLGGAQRFLAVHVRRTDHYAVAMRRHVTDDAFARFCDATSPLAIGAAGHDQPSAPQLPIFIATDCATTQAAFATRYGPRCVYGSHHIGRTAVEPGPQMSASVELPTSFRQTDLRASVVDLLTCAQALCFKGSRYSSFSDGISRLRTVRGTTHARDEHEHLNPPSDTPYWRQSILRLAAEQREVGDQTIARMLARSGVAEAITEVV